MQFDPTNYREKTNDAGKEKDENIKLPVHAISQKGRFVKH